MSFGKSSSNQQGSSNQTTNQTTGSNVAGTQVATPNNLPGLNTGWQAIEQLLNGTNGSSTANANTGINTTMTGAANTAGAANGALTSLTDIAGSGSPNGANADLTPIANGSQIGNNNPNFQNLVDQISQSDQASTDGGMAADGRYGSGADANAFNTTMANETGQLGYANYNQSLQNQLTAAGQLSTNNTNSANQVLAALGLIPQTGAASTAAGAAQYAAGTAPANTFAQIMQLLGSGGGTGTNTGTSTGTAAGTSAGTSTGSSTTTSGSIAPTFSFGPLSFG